MDNSNKLKVTQITLLLGLFGSALFAFLIGISAGGLASFQIIGKTVPFAYPWRLVDPTTLSHLTAWAGYLLHNLTVWILIFLAQRSRPKFSNQMRWFNWALIGVNIFFIVLHWLQSHLWYDGLAQDVPELTALGSVALLLMVVIILETPRRGLIFGKKFKFKPQFMQIVRKVHGYLFSWAIIYTFWYHPTEGTIGHLAGFFYIFLLFLQSALIFNRGHLNKAWTLFLEVFVLLHGTLVAIYQGAGLWPMFAFGFGGMIVLTQMFGVGLKTWGKYTLGGIYIALAVGTYIVMNRMGSINEIIRIPVLDYMVIFLLYGIYLGVAGIGRLVKKAE
jgi:hypothetical protein